eukprot:4067999-Prymnesium_polylepis.1
MEDPSAPDNLRKVCGDECKHRGIEQGHALAGAQSGTCCCWRRAGRSFRGFRQGVQCRGWNKHRDHARFEGRASVMRQRHHLSTLPARAR